VCQSQSICQLTDGGWQVVGGDAAARYRLQRIISTREEDYLGSVPPNSMEDLEQYAEGTAAQLQALQVETPACFPSYLQAFLRLLRNVCAGPPPFGLASIVGLCTNAQTSVADFFAQSFGAAKT
jgi:hypothetical protein